jgi:NAD+ diphosphatase
MRIASRLVPLPLMSAINSHPSRIDRAGHLRENQATLDQLWMRAKILQIAQGRIRADGYLASDQVALLIRDGEFKEGSRYFLGLDAVTNDPYFAWDTRWTTARTDEEMKIGFTTLREVGADLSDIDVELALHAVALSNWHQSHPCCARCGAPTRVDLGGAVRVCDVDKSQHHPRTDGAVIVLVRDNDDRILLGHQPVWPEGRFSCFAGFLEPSETFEQCVAREVFEEAGVVLRDITYLGSQPWPFPASIMIAFDAVTDSPETARPDGAEITEVKWFTRDQLRAEAKAGTLLLPPSISVARKMIERWLGETAQGGETWR